MSTRVSLELHSVVLWLSMQMTLSCDRKGDPNRARAAFGESPGRSGRGIQKFDGTELASSRIPSAGGCRHCLREEIREGNEEAFTA